VNVILPVVDQDTAREKLERQRFKRLRRSLTALLNRLPSRHRDAAGPPAPRRPLPYMEVVWMPAYHVTIDLTAKGRTHPVDVMVGGRDDQFAMMNMADLTFDRHADPESFPPTIDEPQAEQVARSGIVTAILRTPGWGAKPTIGQTRHIELVQYPFWVYHFERRAGLLDIKILDAVTGNLPGPKTKSTILRAFVEGRDGHAN